MALEVFNNYRASEENTMKGRCNSYRFYHVTIKMDDGSMMDGIIENVDGDNVTVLVGEDVMADENDGSMSRQPYRNRYRRYRPRNFPINRVIGLGLLGYPIVPPIFPPYPYPYYPY